MDILLLKAFTNSSTICTWSLVNLSDCIELESIFILLSIIFAFLAAIVFLVACTSFSICCPDHLNVATSLNNLAELYRNQGNYAQAEPLYKRSLAIMESILGPEHPDVATNLNNLAMLYHAQGHYAQAEPLYKRSLLIRRKRSRSGSSRCRHLPEQPCGTVPSKAVTGWPSRSTNARWQSRRRHSAPIIPMSPRR